LFCLVKIIKIEFIDKKAIFVNMDSNNLATFFLY